MNLIHLIAQDTQPIVTGLPGWAVGILAIIGALGPFFLAWLAYKRAGEAKVTAGEAKVDSASALTAVDATQQSVTRVSNRQNALTSHVVSLAEKMPPPGSAGDAGDAGATAPRPTRPPAPTTGTTVLVPGAATVTGGTGAVTNWQQEKP